MSSEEAPPRRAVVGVVGLVVGTALVALGAFLPWIVTGGAARSSFASVRSADRLGIVDGGVGLVALRAWYLAPLVAALVPVLVVLHRIRWAAAVGLTLAGLTAAVALAVVALAPDTGIGPWVSLVGGATVVAGAVLVTAGGRPRGAPSTPMH